MTDAKGKTTAVPLTAEEIEKLTALVRESIGFKQDRGDSVKVINAPFKVETDAVPVEAPLVEAARHARPACARPPCRRRWRSSPCWSSSAWSSRALRCRRSAPQPLPGRRRTLEAIADDPTSLPALPRPPRAVRTGEHIESARQWRGPNPAAVAGILRNWVDGESAAPAAR